MSEIIKKTKSDSRVAKKQVRGLESIGFLRRKKIRGNSKKQIKAGAYFAADPDFDFHKELNVLVLKSSPTSKEKMLKKILKLGRMKLALIAGVFLNNSNNRVDLLLIGDNISQRRLVSFLSEMESEVGREIEYAAMDSKEFEYRFHMFDRFVHDILEKPHEKMLNKIKYLE